MRRYVRRIGTFACLGSDGSAYEVEAIREFFSLTLDGDLHVEPLDCLVFCRSRRIDWVSRGRYRTPEGLELSTGDPEAP